MFFDEVYKIFDHHSKDKFDQKTMVIKLLTSFNNKGSGLLTDYKVEHNEDDYLTFPASSLVNNTIGKYYEIIEKNYDAKGNFKSETDFDEFNNEMLIPFIENVLEQRENPKLFDRRLEPLLEDASNIRKQIQLI